MDDFIHRLRNGNLKGYGLEKNRNDRRKPKIGGHRKNGTSDWPVIKKHLEKISDNHRRIAIAEERKAKSEERKADAMERIADCLSQLLLKASPETINTPNQQEVPDVRAD